MSALELARPLIARFEGCRLYAYADGAGYWTIGYGSRWLVDGRPVTRGMTLTQAGADALLDRQLGTLADQVDSLLPGCATDCQRAACYSLAWNIGIGAFRGSAVLREMRNGNIPAAARAFGGWVYAGGKKLPGLVTRRAAERALFEEHTPPPCDVEPADDADALNEAELRQIEAR